MKTAIVTVPDDSYKRFEQRAREAGMTLPKYLSELLEDQDVVPTAKRRAEKVIAEDLQRPFYVPPKAPKQKAPPSSPKLESKNQGAEKKPHEKLRGLAVHSPARRSEIAKKAAATRKRRAEEAARKRR